MQWYQVINAIFIVLVSISTLVYFPHLLYCFLGFFAKPKQYKAATVNNRFAIIVCAKDEEAVIGNLIDSLHGQTYPQELIDIFVMADCCTDNTANVARQKGAFVYEISSKVTEGKGETLDRMLKILLADYADKYDAYILFDADNLAAPDFVQRMNDCYAEGNLIATGYRNAKNFDNFYASGTALLFYREMCFLHPSRQALNTSTHVAGTGLLVATEIIKQIGGWPYRTLTEDLEFSLDMVHRGQKIAFCSQAVFYDEQPVDRQSSKKQRVRWLKGAFQSNKLYKKKLLKGIFKKGGYARLDLLLQTTSAETAVFFTLGGYLAFIGIGYLAKAFSGAYALSMLWVAIGFIGFFLVMVLLNTEATVLLSWKHIPAPTKYKVRALFTFPLFMASIAEIALIALFSRNVTWHKVPHKIAKSVQEITYNGSKPQ